MNNRSGLLILLFVDKGQVLPPDLDY